MTEIRETHVERHRSRAGLFVVTFLVAALLGATVVVVLMNVHASLYWPAGQLTFNIRPATPPATTSITIPLSRSAAPADASVVEAVPPPIEPPSSTTQSDTTTPQPETGQPEQTQ